MAFSPSRSTVNAWPTCWRRCDAPRSRRSGTVSLFRKRPAPDPIGGGIRFSIRKCDNAKKLQTPQRDFPNQVAFALGEDEIGALPRRQYALVEVDQVDPVPDRGRGGGRFGVRQGRIAVEVGLGIRERGSP